MCKGSAATNDDSRAVIEKVIIRQAVVCDSDHQLVFMSPRARWLAAACQKIVDLCQGRGRPRCSFLRGQCFSKSKRRGGYLSLCVTETGVCGANLLARTRA